MYFRCVYATILLTLRIKVVNAFCRHFCGLKHAKHCQDRKRKRNRRERRAKECMLCKCQFAFLSYSKLKCNSSVTAQGADMIVGLVTFPASKSFVSINSSLRKLRKQNTPNSILEPVFQGHPASVQFAVLLQICRHRQCTGVCTIPFLGG